MLKCQNFGFYTSTPEFVSLSFFADTPAKQIVWFVLPNAPDFNR